MTDEDDNRLWGILDQSLRKDMEAQGFSFDDAGSTLAFVRSEQVSALASNVSYYFNASSTVLDEDRVDELFNAVMGQYMRNRLLILLPILCVIAVVSLLSNLLGIRAVVGIRHKLPRHWVLMNLSMSNSFLAPLNVVKVTSEVLAYSAFDQFFRRYLNLVWQFFFLLCPISLFLLAIDNVVAVVAPFYYERKSNTGSRDIMLVVGAITWCTIISLILLLFFLNLQHSQTVQVIVANVLMIIIAGTVTLYLALALKVEIYRRKLMANALPSSMANNDRQKREMLRSRMKTTATTLSIVLTLAGLWSPFVAYLLIPDSSKFSHVPYYINFLCSALALFQLGTAIDPIVYCCRMVEVRRSLVNIFNRSVFRSLVDQVSPKRNRPNQQQHSVPLSALAQANRRNNEVGNGNGHNNTMATITSNCEDNNNVTNTLLQNNG